MLREVGRTQKPWFATMGMWRIYSNPDPHGGTYMETSPLPVKACKILAYARRSGPLNQGWRSTMFLYWIEKHDIDRHPWLAKMVTSPWKWTILERDVKQYYLKCHVCSDTRPRIFRSHPKDRPTHKGMWKIYSNLDPHRIYFLPNDFFLYLRVWWEWVVFYLCQSSILLSVSRCSEDWPFVLSGIGVNAKTGGGVRFNQYIDSESVDLRGRQVLCRHLTVRHKTATIKSTLTWC
jgi:hypothetical protein